MRRYRAPSRNRACLLTIAACGAIHVAVGCIIPDTSGARAMTGAPEGEAMVTTSVPCLSPMHASTRSGSRTRPSTSATRNWRRWPSCGAWCGRAGWWPSRSRTGSASRTPRTPRRSSGGCSPRSGPTPRRSAGCCAPASGPAAGCGAGACHRRGWQRLLRNIRRHPRYGSDGAHLDREKQRGYRICGQEAGAGRPWGPVSEPVSIA